VKFLLEAANGAIESVRRGRIEGAGVLIPRGMGKQEIVG